MAFIIVAGTQDHSSIILIYCIIKEQRFYISPFTTTTYSYSFGLLGPLSRLSNAFYFKVKLKLVVL